jgi:hypothetical protein
VETQTQVMQWQMYAPGTVMAFSAIADTKGIRVMLERDCAPVISADAADTTVLLRVSKELRTQLLQRGFTATPLAERAAVLGGGPCWGPAAPLDCSLIESLR